MSTEKSMERRRDDYHYTESALDAREWKLAVE